MNKDMKIQKILQAIYDLSEDVLHMEKQYENIPFMKKLIAEEKDWVSEIMRYAVPGKDEKGLQLLVGSVLMEMEGKNVNPVICGDIELLFNRITKIINL